MQFSHTGCLRFLIGDIRGEKNRLTGQRILPKPALSKADEGDPLSVTVAWPLLLGRV